MNHFELKHGELWCEDVPLKAIAEEVGTPVYVYSRATLERHARVFSEALTGLDDPWIAYALKSNPNLAVIKVLQRQGFGADVVSAGEMARAMADLLRDAELRSRMERLGQQRAAHFSWQDSARKTLEVYYAVAERNRRGHGQALHAPVPSR